VHWGVKSEKNWTMLCGPGACSVHAPRRPSTPVLARAPAWKGALLERTCSLQLRALVRSERVSSHLGKNLGSPAAELLRRERAHAKRTHTAEGGPPHFRTAPAAPRQFLSVIDKAKKPCVSKKLLRILSNSAHARREDISEGSNMYTRHQAAEGVSFEPGNGPSQLG